MRLTPPDIDSAGFCKLFILKSGFNAPSQKIDVVETDDDELNSASASSAQHGCQSPLLAKDNLQVRPALAGRSHLDFNRHKKVCVAQALQTFLKVLTGDRPAFGNPEFAADKIFSSPFQAFKLNFSDNKSLTRVFRARQIARNIT